MTLYADVAGERLDAFLARSVEGLTRSSAQRLLEEGHVLRCGKKAKKNDRHEQKQENSASAMIQVAGYGIENWKALLTWGIQNRIFNPQEISFLKAAIAMETGKFPSEKQCGRILQVLAKAREESWPH